MVPLKNKSSHQTFHGTFYPSEVGRRTSDKLYDVQKVRSAKWKRATVKQPHSFMLLPGETKLVHPAALHLSQVKAARKSGWLEVVEVSAPAAKAKPAPKEKAPVTLSEPVTEASEGTSRKRGR